MPLIPGARLGVYEVTALIGEGGMGQVYRARDTKLHRDVALKVLPDSFANDPDRLARFQREAQVLASLNHPNIAHIHGLEDSGGVRALVMELVEGDDLAQRIARGAIPIDEALPIAKQIAEALEAAHEQGIIHRDLKPANIKVRFDGTVKVLDFGLAKAMDPPTPSPNVSQSPTITTPAMTQAGMILGTAAYMSPEQAKGRPADKRSDVWAFGVVLYEMLSGRRAFSADDVSETLAAVMMKDPDWSVLPATVPPVVMTVLRRCLQKNPKQRLGDVQDLRLALDGAFETVVPQTTTPGIRSTSASARALPLVAAIAALVFAIAWLIEWAPWRTEKPVDNRLLRLDVDLGADVSLPAPGGGSSVAISPDGTRLVYASGMPPKLFTRQLDRPRATELPGTQGSTIPFFSPDGQWVGFVLNGRVNKISVEGGAVGPLTPQANAVLAGAAWSEDGSLFMVLGPKLVRIPAAGGESETLAETRNGELGFSYPQALPGGKAILLAADNPGPVDKTTVELVTLADRQRKTLVQGGASPRYLATSVDAGHLVYLNQATLFAIPFDLNSLMTHGTAVPVLDDVAHESLVGTGQFDVSRTGTLIYRKAVAGASTLTTLQWVDATGKRESLQAKPGTYQDVSLSPDGKRVALVIVDGANQDVWIYDPQRDAMSRLTFDGATYRYPIWTPDGNYVVFASVGNGMFVARADGAGQGQKLNDSKTAQYPRSFTPDGKRLTYFENLGGGGQLWTVPLTDEGGQLKAGKPEALLKSSSTDRFPALSPDGRWLAYESTGSFTGTTEVYVRAFSPPPSGPGGKWQISTNGGATPIWSQRGHDLLYRSGDQIMAASYTVQGDTFTVEKPRVWIAKIGGTQFDVAPDGKRAIVVTPIESADNPKQEHEVVFVQNFFDELRRRVPADKR